MILPLLSFVLLCVSLFLLGASCKRAILGIDPTTGRTVLIRDYTNCGPSCKFRDNRNRITYAFRKCVLFRVFGYASMIAAVALFAWLYAYRQIENA